MSSNYPRSPVSPVPVSQTPYGIDWTSMLHDLAALAALAGMLARDSWPIGAVEAEAYKHADAFLAERARRQEGIKE